MENQEAPHAMTAVQACKYLGITWDQWKTQMHFFHKGLPRGPIDPATGERTRLFGSWMPLPIGGPKSTTTNEYHITSALAIFDAADIEKLKESKTFKSTGGTKKPTPKVKKKPTPKVKKKPTSVDTREKPTTTLGLLCRLRRHHDRASEMLHILRAADAEGLTLKDMITLIG